MSSFTESIRVSRQKESLAVIPYFYNDFWAFMVLRFDKSQKVMNLVVPLDFTLAGQLLDKVHFISGLLSVEGEQLFRYRNRAGIRFFLNGVVSGTVGPAPVHAMVLSLDASVKKALRGQVDPLSNPQACNDVEGSCAVVLLESTWAEKLPWKEPELVRHVDLYEGGPFCVWKDIVKVLKCPLYMVFYVPPHPESSKSTRKTLQSLVEKKNVPSLVQGMFVLQIEPSARTPGELRCLSLVPDFEEAHKIGSIICEKKSPLANMCVGNNFDLFHALDLLAEGVKVSKDQMEKLKKTIKERIQIKGDASTTKGSVPAVATAAAATTAKSLFSPVQKSEPKESKQVAAVKAKEAAAAPPKAKQPPAAAAAAAAKTTSMQEAKKILEGVKKEAVAPQKKKKEEEEEEDDAPKPSPSEKLTIGDFLGLNAGNMKGSMNYFKRVLREAAEKAEEERKEEDLTALQQCTGCSREGFDMPVCERCGVTPYCSEKCLLDGWRGHQKDCREIRHDRTLDIIGAVVKKGSKLEASKA